MPNRMGSGGGGGAMHMAHEAALAGYNDSTATIEQVQLKRCTSDSPDLTVYAGSSSRTFKYEFDECLWSES